MVESKSSSSSFIEGADYLLFSRHYQEYLSLSGDMIGNPADRLFESSSTVSNRCYFRLQATSDGSHYLYHPYYDEYIFASNDMQGNPADRLIESRKGQQERAMFHLIPSGEASCYYIYTPHYDEYLFLSNDVAGKPPSHMVESRKGQQERAIFEIKLACRFVTIQTAKYETYLGVDPTQTDPKKRLRMSKDVDKNENFVWERIPSGKGWEFKTLSGWVLCFPDSRGHGDCSALLSDYADQNPARKIHLLSNFTDKDEDSYGGVAIKNIATGLILNITGGDSIGTGDVGAEPDDHTWTRMRSFKVLNASIAKQVVLQQEMTNFQFNFSVLDPTSAQKSESFITLAEVEIGPEKVNVSNAMTYSKSYSDSFKWSLTEKIGAGLKVSGEVGVPLVASGKVEASASVEVSSVQEKTSTQQKTLSWTQTVSFSAPGKYKINGVVYEYALKDCPFTADITYTGTLSGNDAAAEEVEAAIRDKGSNVIITKKEAYKVTGKITGFITANSAFAGKLTIV